MECDFSKRGIVRRKELIDDQETLWSDHFHYLWSVIYEGEIKVDVAIELEWDG